MKFSLREMTPADSDLLRVLAAESPDAGMVQFSPEFFISPYAFIIEGASHTQGVVATHPDHPGLVGSAAVTQMELTLAGEKRQAGYLSSLMVHPALRRQGLATRLAQWRIRHVREQVGEDAVLFANIQQGNVASLRNAEKWATQFVDKVKYVPLPTLATSASSRFTIREIMPDEYEIFATGHNTYCEGQEFVRTLTAQNMAEWLQIHASDTPVHHWYGAFTSQGALVAGVALAEHFRLRELRVRSMPGWMTLANRLLKVIPPDGTLRDVAVSAMWYAPGYEAALHDLVREVRVRWHKHANIVPVMYDDRSKLGRILRVPLHLPTTSITIALYSPVPVYGNRLIQPYLRD
ncbi:MAG: GNAT family N-acetyltransferase [Anaerolineae bacterium]|nr:GNAT family N-acetyltransferase [Anaerolineae bacterium]